MRWERLLSADLRYGFLLKRLEKTTGTSAATYITVPAAVSGEYLPHVMRLIQSYMYTHHEKV
jgi:hypothetical protein